MVFVKLSVVAAIAALVNAVPSPSPLNHVVHEKRGAALHEWKKTSSLEQDAIIPMRIGLTQTNLDKGYDMLMEVADTDSPKYGKHWTAEQVHNTFAPDEETVKNVRAWLTRFGIHDSRIVHSDNKGWIAVDITVQEAEALLDTEYYEYEHATSSKVRVGCDEYKVPEHLRSHIDYILPGIKLSPVVKRTVKIKRSTPIKQKRASLLKVSVEEQEAHALTAAEAVLPVDLQKCGTDVTIACIRALYNVPVPTTALPGNSVGTFQQGSYFSEDDVNAYFKTYAPYIPQGTFPINATIDGASYSVPVKSESNSGEANIDIDMLTAIVYPQTVTLYQTDDDIYEPVEVVKANVFNTFLDALDGSYCNYTAYGETGDDPKYDAVYPHDVPGGYKGTRQCGVYTPAKVITASYGEAEANFPAAYVRRQCDEFMKLGLQGHTILFASGDYGVASFPGDLGIQSGCLGPQHNIFAPQYPSGCPYVLSVGGSQIGVNRTVYDPEVVMSDNLGGDAANFSSSGGFSNYFSRPTYQDGHVQTYFHRAHLTYPYYSGLETDLSTTTGIYNRYGRGYPDVAANGAKFPAQTQGRVSHFYGASLSAPLFAGILTLLNQELEAAGKPPVGFVNPAFYRHDYIFNDVTEGNNLGCGTQGFKAVKGWDPVTGLGTPNYPKMLELFKSLH